MLNPHAINSRILDLEAERKALHSTNKDHSSLYSAIHDNNLAVLDQFPTPSILKIKALILKKHELQLQKTNNHVTSLISSITTPDYDSLLSVKTLISNLDNADLMSQLTKKLSTKITNLQKPLYATFTEQLSTSNWLRLGSISPAITTTFIHLINLQSLTESSSDDSSSSLWAFDAIAKTFTISFNYHFNSSKVMTIDKPELFFNYFLNYLSENLLKIARIWDLSTTNSTDKFSYNEFIKSAIKPVSSKLTQFIEILSTQDDNTESTLLLTHLINETIGFDTRLINEFHYDPSNDSSWPGLFSLFNYTHLSKLLLNEVHYYNTQFETIINQQDTFQIDYHSVSSTDLKPTLSALKFKILIENLTFKNFNKFFKLNYDSNTSLSKYKLKIFSLIYLNLLKKYLNILNDGYIALNELMKSSKQHTEINITNLNGVERILRLYCSLKFISNSLNKWNQEFIFIELNELYNSNSNEISISLFDFILNDYNTLETKIWKLLEFFINNTISQSLKSYMNLNTWNSPSHNQDISSTSTLTPSVELNQLTSTILSYLTYLSKILPQHELSKLKKFTISQIIEFLIRNVIKLNHFNQQGVMQFNLDYNSILESLDVRDPQVWNSSRMLDFIKILKLTDGTQLQCTEGTTLKQFAQVGEFTEFKRELDIKYLKDAEILDVLLRIH